MKKLNKITAALASLALTAAAFTGCVNTHPDLEYLNSAEKVWIVGSIDEFGAWTLNKALELKGDDEAVFTGEFTATTAGAEFKVVIDDNSNWDTAFWSGDTTPFGVDTEVVCSTVGGMDNCVVTLDIGVKYQITVDASNASASKVTFTAIGGDAATKLSVLANGISNGMTNNAGTYTTTVVAKGTEMLFTISDGSNTYGLAEGDTFALETEFELVEVTEATAIPVSDGVGYKFTATIDDEGVITLSVKDLNPIAIASVPGSFNNWQPGSVDAQPTLVKSTTTEKVYVYEWTQATAGDVEFKVSTGTTWDDPNYAGADLTVDESATLTEGAGANVVVEDLEADTKYALFITTTATSVSVEVVSYIDIVITLPSAYASVASIPTIESVIGWGGVHGYWKHSTGAWTNGSLTDVPVTAGKITLSISSLSAPADWFNEQKGTHDFKLGLVFAAGSGLDNYYTWFDFDDEVTLPETGI